MDVAVEECVSLLRDRLRMEEVQIRYFSRRVEVQLTAVGSLPQLSCQSAFLLGPAYAVLFLMTSFLAPALQLNSSERIPHQHRSS